MSMGAALDTSATSFDLLRMDRQIQHQELRRRITRVGAWAGLVALGAKRGGVLGWFAAGVGVYGFVGAVLEWRESRPEWKKAPPARGPLVRRLLGRSRPDIVERESRDSFPASDPPAI